MASFLAITFNMKKEDLIEDLRKRGFSEKIIKAFEKIKRENFIPENLRKHSYEDIPLPIGYEQTISQPYTIAFMLNFLELEDKQKILEVGSGSGYVLALISEICKKCKIFGIERIKELAESSKKRLTKYKNVKVIYGDGSKGLEKEKPFDRILASAAAKNIPQKLVNQLKIRGILVAPVRSSIVKIQRFTNENKIKEYPGFRFVPLIED